MGWILPPRLPRRKRAVVPRAVRKHAFAVVVLHRSIVEADFLTSLRAAGADVWVWGARSIREGRRFQEAGVEGFIVDAPRRFFPLRDAAWRE
jgi:glycerophosphoryl diester phosphodiesterase